jgi:spermidine/putrescine transport system permease protein
MSDEFGHRSYLLGGFVALVLAFLFVPLIIVVLFSFNSSAAVTLPFHGFSLHWYSAAFEDSEIVAAFEHSAIVASGVAVATLILGTAAAYGVSRSRSRWSGGLGALFYAPIIFPGIFLGIALLIFFARIELELSLLTVAIGHFVYAFPFVFVIARLGFDRSDRWLEEVAADLGASPLQAFRKVVLPQVTPVLAGAAALAFMLSFDEFFITNFVVASEPTVPILIFARLRHSVNPTVNVISTVMLVITALIAAGLAISSWRAARRRLAFG